MKPTKQIVKLLISQRWRQPYQVFVSQALHLNQIINTCRHSKHISKYCGMWLEEGCMKLVQCIAELWAAG